VVPHGDQVGGVLKDLLLGRAAWAILTRLSCCATLEDHLNERACYMAKASINSRGTTPVDVHIGQKIRTRRNLLGLSQTELADAAGISFQQIQKYEKGTNRVGAGRLQQFSDGLAFHHPIFLKAHPRSERNNLRRRKADYRRPQSFHF
jgi:predicted transcriptional regulator